MAAAHGAAPGARCSTSRSHRHAHRALELSDFRFYNAAGITIAARGLLSPVVCAILMPLSSVTVVAFACGLTTWLGRRIGLKRTLAEEADHDRHFPLIPLSIVTAAIFLGGFIWAVRSGQYEDTCTPALRLLTDDSDMTKAKTESLAKKQQTSRTTENECRTNIENEMQ